MVRQFRTDPKKIEHRLGVELRATERRRLVGYAAVFNTPTRIGSSFTEQIKPGAFAQSLASNEDILALVDHEPSHLLGRTSTGSLTLNEDARGLRFDLELPDTSLGRDIEALAARGDLGGMSFGFRVPDGGERWAGDQRELLNIELAEISVVHSWPAYEGTEIALRQRPHNPRQALRQRYLQTIRFYSQ